MGINGKWDRHSGCSKEIHQAPTSCIRSSLSLPTLTKKNFDQNDGADVRDWRCLKISGIAKRSSGLPAFGTARPDIGHVTGKGLLPSTIHGSLDVTEPHAGHSERTHSPYLLARSAPRDPGPEAAHFSGRTERLASTGSARTRDMGRSPRHRRRSDGPECGACSACSASSASATREHRRTGWHQQRVCRTTPGERRHGTWRKPAGRNGQGG